MRKLILVLAIFIGTLSARAYYPVDLGDSDITILGFTNNGSAAYTEEEDNEKSGASATIDFSTGNKHLLTLNQNATIEFSGITGATGVTLILVQDNGGSQTVTWDSEVKWPGGTAPTLTTTNAGIDMIGCYYRGGANGNYLCDSSLDIK